MSKIMNKKPNLFATLQNNSEEKFRRLTGVKRATFDAMLEFLEAAHTLKKAKGGRPLLLISTISL